MATVSFQDIRVRFAPDAIYSRGWLDEHPDAAQRIYRKYAGTNPVCMCTPAGVSMYIVLKKSAYIATMPGRTHHHSERCPSFGFDETTTGRSQYTKRALYKHSHGFRLQLSDHARSCSGDSLSMSAVLQLLWETSGLNYWSPRMQGKRNYFTATRALLRASDSLWLGPDHLSDALTVPLRNSHDLATSGPSYLAGQVIRVFPSPYGIGIRIKYFPETIWVSASNFEMFGLGACYRDPVDPQLPDLYQFALIRVTKSGTGQHSAVQFGWLSLTRDFLPAFSSEEAYALGHLVDSGERFYRCMPYDVPSPSLPFIVRYCADSPPVAVSSPSALGGALIQTGSPAPQSSAR